MKCLVIDDHALIRDALRAVLLDAAGEGNPMTVIEAASSREAGEALARHSDLDLILLDLGLPDRDGLELLVEIREEIPEVGVLILSAREDRSTILAVLQHGAMGFIPKSAPRSVMIGALRLVFSGGTYIPPAALAPVAPAETRPGPSPHDLGLTDRQVDVLSLMMRGKSNKLICRALGLAETTVKNHVTAILKALDVQNRTEAAIKANELGWILPQR